MNKYELYKEAQQERESAENWLLLKDSRDSQNGKNFSLSLQHSQFMLMRCGQHFTGGKNYHESPKEFNEAMLKVIQANYKTLTEQAIGLMKSKEDIALVQCSEFVKKIQDEIDSVKKLKLT